MEQCAVQLMTETNRARLCQRHKKDLDVFPAIEIGILSVELLRTERSIPVPILAHLPF
jgi:hypothetical protein